MKVVDMFGCGLPVCAVNFQCLDELVQDGVNGLVFSSSQQLADRLVELLAEFPRQTYQLDQLRSNVTQQRERWDTSWTKVAWPLLSGT